MARAIIDEDGVVINDKSKFTTISGQPIDFSRPDRLFRCLRDGAFKLGDVAHALAQINRYNGHLPRPYSVAHHSLAVRKIAQVNGLGPMGQLLALLHDAHEAYLGDITSPMKRMLDGFNVPLRTWECEIDKIIREWLLSPRAQTKAQEWLDSGGYECVAIADGTAYALEKALRAKDGDCVNLDTRYLRVVQGIMVKVPADRVARAFEGAVTFLVQEVERTVNK